MPQRPAPRFKIGDYVVKPFSLGFGSTGDYDVGKPFVITAIVSVEWEPVVKGPGYYYRGESVASSGIYEHELEFVHQTPPLVESPYRKNPIT